MSLMNGKCDRCGKASGVFLMSVFNTQDLCMDCSDTEKEDPRYKAAQKAEGDAVRRGDLNFPGIGR